MEGKGGNRREEEIHHDFTLFLNISQTCSGVTKAVQSKAATVIESHPLRFAETHVMISDLLLSRSCSSGLNRIEKAWLLRMRLVTAVVVMTVAVSVVWMVSAVAAAARAQASRVIKSSAKDT